MSDDNEQKPLTAEAMPTLLGEFSDLLRPHLGEFNALVAALESLPTKEQDEVADAVVTVVNALVAAAVHRGVPQSVVDTLGPGMVASAMISIFAERTTDA